MRKLIVSLMAGLMLVSGCAILKPYAELKPLDKAKVSVEAFSSWYVNTYAELQSKWETASESEREVLIPVNDKMNQIKPLLVKYNKLVLVWSETNVQPTDLPSIVAEIEKLMYGIIEALK